MKKVYVLGAGHAGLIAARMLKREGFDVTVLEKQLSLPLNHYSVLRFRTDALQKALGVPLKKVRVIKDVIDSMNPILDTLHYSYKVTGQYRTDRSVPHKCEVVERYVYDGNLSEFLAEGLDIKYHFDIIGNNDSFGYNNHSPIISTAPMDALPPGLTGIDPFSFVRSSVSTITARLVGFDAYLSAYVPDPRSRISRINVTGNLLQIDTDYLGSVADPEKAIDDALDKLHIYTGYDEVKAHKGIGAKLLPIDERTRKRAIMKMTDDALIYSVGRQATWRPNLLLDDVVDDVRKVIMMLNGYSNQLVNAKDYSNV